MISFSNIGQITNRYERSPKMNYLKSMYASTLLAPIKNKKGQTLVEYALILVLIAIAIMLAMKFFSGETGNLYNRVGSSLQ